MLLFVLHLVAFILHSVSCGLSWGHNKDVFTNRDIYYNKFEYISTNTSVTTSSTKIIVGEKQNYMTWITVNEFITALSHLLALLYFLVFKYPDHPYEIARRTIEYTATAAILQIALVLGAGDVLFQDVVFIFVINAAIQYIGFQLDKMEYFFFTTCDYTFSSKTKPYKSPAWNYSTAFFVISFGLLVSEIIYVYTLSTTIDFGPGPLENQKDFLTFIGIMYILFYVSFGFVKLFGHYNRKYFDDEDGWFYVEDCIYVILSVTCKISLSWMLIGNIFNGFYNLCKDTNNDTCKELKEDEWYGNWNSFQIGLSIFGSLGILISAYVAYSGLKKINERIRNQRWG